jgi:hypothetical protein
MALGGRLPILLERLLLPLPQRLADPIQHFLDARVSLGRDLGDRLDSAVPSRRLGGRVDTALVVGCELVEDVVELSMQPGVEPEILGEAQVDAMELPLQSAQQLAVCRRQEHLTTAFLQILCRRPAPA